MRVMAAWRRAAARAHHGHQCRPLAAAACPAARAWLAQWCSSSHGIRFGAAAAPGACAAAAGAGVRASGKGQAPRHEQAPRIAGLTHAPTLAASSHRIGGGIHRSSSPRCLWVANWRTSSHHGRCRAALHHDALHPTAPTDAVNPLTTTAAWSWRRHHHRCNQWPVAPATRAARTAPPQTLRH